MNEFARLASIVCAVVVLAALPAAAWATDSAGKSLRSPTTGAASASGPDEPSTHLKPPLAPLHLTDAQHQKIRAAVAGLDTEITFQLKKSKSKRDFTPTLGAKVPSGLPVHALPSSLRQQLPMLADYKYMKVKGQIAIVNPMTKTIVDTFPEKQG